VSEKITLAKEKVNESPKARTN